MPTTPYEFTLNNNNQHQQQYQQYQQMQNNPQLNWNAQQNMNGIAA
jgi:hypothetical protein